MENTPTFIDLEHRWDWSERRLVQSLNSLEQIGRMEILSAC